MSQGLFHKDCKKVLIALGSNETQDVSQTRKVVLAALDALSEKYTVCGVGDLYKTPCFPADSGPDFVNGACAIECAETPEMLLQTLHDIEAEFGRTRERRWGKRTLDLDVIAFGDRVAPDVATQTHWRTLPIDAQMTTAPTELILPHPRVQDRAFVLVPLADIAPDWVHPVLGRTVREMLAARPAEELSEITPL